MNVALALLQSKRVRQILGGLIAIIVLPLLSIVVLLASFQQQQRQSEDDGYSVNGTCNVSGGALDNNGKSVFEKNAKGGALEGKTDDLVKIAKKHKIPPTLFIAIVASESQWGKGANATKQNNPLSVMGAGTIHDSEYSTLDKGLEAGAKNLEDLYISKGLNTPEKIGPKYAPTVGATNDPGGSNNNWIPTVKSIMKDLGGSKIKDKGCSVGGKGKALNINGKTLPKWSNASPGGGNLYTPGQCTWYAYGIRKKIGKPISTYWGDAHNWNDRAKSEGYKVDEKPEEGALFIAEQGAGGHDTVHGHVGVVIGVGDGGKSFKISEMNYNGAFKVNQRTVEMTDGYSFIHDK